MVTLTFGSGAVAGPRTVRTDLFTRSSVEAKVAVMALVPEAVRCELVSTHKQTRRKPSQYVPVKNETQTLSLLFF